MRKVVPFVAAAVALAVFGLGVFRAAEEAAKYSTEEVMKKLHKGGKPPLFNKVVDGKASKDDKDLVVALYESLTKNKPSKGDEKVWKEKTETVLAAAKEVAAGESGAEAKLKKAADCKACHNLFK